MGYEFGIWDASVQEYKGQPERIARARKADVTPQSIDQAEKSGIFPGSGETPYITTLESCTCPDFSRRNLPCKHMYRLAMELGLIDAEFISGINRHDYVEAIDGLDKPLQLLLYDLAGSRLSCSAQPYFELYLRTEELDALVSSGFCVESAGGYAACSRSYIHKNVIASTLKKAGISPDKQKLSPTARWKSVFQYIQNLYDRSPEIISRLFAVVDLDAQAFDHRNKICSHIRKKYRDEMDDDLE